MRALSRDLLLLSRNKSINEKEMELEVEKLNKILMDVESITNFCTVNEIIDINLYKVIQNPVKIERIIRQKKLKPFQFINNKN